MQRIALLFSVMILSSCYYDLESELYPEPCEVPETPTYTANIELLINSQCATPSCHVAGGNANGNFETFNGVSNKVDNGSFEQEVLINQSMPPNGTLSACDLELIETWLATGAAE